MNADSVMVDEYVFDLFDFDLDFDNVSTYDSVGTTTEESTGSGSGEEKIGKLDKKVTKSTSTVRKLSRNPRGRKPRAGTNKPAFDLIQYMGRETSVPLKRQKPTAALYVFPSFDKCDSLLYFPYSFTRHINSSDFTALYKLMNSHLDKNCSINMGSCDNIEHVLNMKAFVKLFEFMDQFQPDRIMCVHTTKVVENRILSAIYMKFTDVKSIVESALETGKKNIPTKDFPIPGGCGLSRDDHLKMKVADSKKPAEEQQRLCAMVEQYSDLVINLRIDLTITIDEISKKVTDLRFDKELLSMHPAECIR